MMQRLCNKKHWIAALAATTTTTRSPAVMVVSALSQKSVKTRVSSSSSSVQRSFQFVPYGSSAPQEGVTIACDGRVPGATLEVTHWTGNETPDNLYADTSTGMALNLAKQQKDYPEYATATVLNNHFDTDGVLSVWTCLEPEQALSYEMLLIQGAEAGDFGEWSSDEGVKLDCALSSILLEDEEDAYKIALQLVPKLANDIVENKGASFEDLWRPGFDKALSGWNDLEDGRAKLWRADPNIVVLEESNNDAWMSPYALHRGLIENDLWKGTTRILRSRKVGKDSFRYNYEKIGHGWVQKLVDRHMVPSADGETLAAEMNKHCSGTDWKKGGSGGLVSLCCTTEPQTMPPDEVAALLSKYDPGCE